MTNLTLKLQEPDPVAFEPYGLFVTPPDQPGERHFFSDALRVRNEASSPVLHVNSVLPQALPFSFLQVERHPHAVQCFFPLDVSRYAVVVMPSDADGRACPEKALGFLMQGTVGVIFHSGVWHLGATVLDRLGHFTVMMWRGGVPQDDEFQNIEPLTLTLPI